MPRGFFIVYFVLLLSGPFNIFSQRVYKDTDNCFDLGYSGFIHKKYLSSINNFELFISNELSTAEPRPDKIRLVYSYLANCYKKIGNYQKAIESYLNSLAYIGLYDAESKLALTFNRLGELYSITGEYDKALEYYSRALRYFNESEWERYIITCHLKIGDIYLIKKDYKTALGHLNLALEMEVAKDIEAPIMIPGIYNKIGEINIEEKDFTAARKNIGEALSFNREATALDPVRIFEMAESYTLLGDVFYQMDKYDIAINYYDSAMTIYKTVNNPDKIALTYKKEGDVWKKSNRFTRAMKCYQNGLELTAGNTGELTAWDNPPIEVLNPDLTIIELLTAKAGLLNDIYCKTKDIESLNRSHNTYILTIEVFNKFRNRILDMETKLFLNSQIRKTYTDAIIVANELLNYTRDKSFAESIFLLSEKSKFSLLSSQMNLMNKKGNLINDSLLLAEKRLAKRINDLKRLIYYENINRDNLSGEPDYLNDSLFALNRQYDKLIETIEKSSPAYKQVKYENINEDLTFFQNGLNGQNVLIEYYLTDEYLLTIVLTDENIEIVKTKIDSIFFNNIKVINVLVKSRNGLNNSIENVESFITSSNELYSVLISPIESLINQYPKLIIVTDGILGYVPFDILLTKPVKDYSGLNKLPYLLKDKTISYAFSATLFCRTGIKKRSKVKNNVLAVAPFVKNHGISSDNELIAELRTRGIEDYSLPGTKNEVDGIAGYYNCEVLLNEKATKSSFLMQAPGYKILHIATHGLIDNEKPDFSRLLFYEDKSDTINDRSLYEYELYNLQLNAGLVVLSACNTGAGKLQKGEGIMNFARGFYYAGVPSIVMTQWGVDDVASAELMSRFYKYLKEGMEKDEALRMAKLSFLEQAKNPLKYAPYFWAGYILVGDTSKIEDVDVEDSNLLLSVSIGIVLLMVFGFLKLKFI